MNVDGVYSLQDDEMSTMSSLPILGNGRGHPRRVCPPPWPLAVALMGYGATEAHESLNG